MKISFQKLIFYFSFSLIASFSIFVWARFIEPNLFQIERLEFQVEGFSGKNLKILHITDSHTNGWTKNEADVLKAIKKTNPNLIFLTGDLVDWKTRDLTACKRLWEGITDGYEGKVWAVLGNHEHRNPRLAEIKELLKETGIKVLDNETKKIAVNGASFYLTGVDDPHLEFADLKKAMHDIPVGGFKILLAHSPEIFEQAKEYDFYLALVGHTHGCQVNIPFICPNIISMTRGKEYVQGLFEEDGMKLYVNRGAGETFIPIRFNALPQVALIIINP